MKSKRTIICLILTAIVAVSCVPNSPQYNTNYDAVESGCIILRGNQRIETQRGPVELPDNTRLWTDEAYMELIYTPL